MHIIRLNGFLTVGYWVILNLLPTSYCSLVLRLDHCKNDWLLDSLKHEDVRSAYYVELVNIKENLRYSR